jgi:aspartate oxidase
MVERFTERARRAVVLATGGEGGFFLATTPWLLRSR